MSTEYFCRLCATKYPITSLKNINELQNDQLDLLILQYLQIKLTNDDVFPNTACDLCCKTLLNFHKFLNEVKTAQQKLRCLFSDFRVKLENEGHDIKVVETKFVEPTSSANRINESENLYSENDSKHIKSEIDYGDDFDAGHFLDNVIVEAHDSDSSLNKIHEETTEEKPTERVKLESKDSKVTNRTQNIRKIVWQCYKCNDRFRSAQRLQDHFQIVHDSKVEYVCIQCNALFKNLVEFKTHYSTHDVLKKSRRRINHECETCGKQFYNLSTYNVHRNSHLGVKPFECEKCGRTFGKKQYKELHKLTNCVKLKNSNGDYKSDSLQNDENRIKSQNNLGESLPINSNSTSDSIVELKWKCTECNECFETANNLKKHSKNFHGITKNKHICTVCDEIFETKELYDDHLETVHNLFDSMKTNSVYKCKWCSKQFNFKSAYLKHTLSHTGIKRFPCNECGKKFHLKQHLIAHSIIHQDNPIDQVKCDQCDKICKNQYLLNRHLRTHRPVDEKKKYKCDICKRKFTYLKSLISHENQGHENVDCICDQCGKVFKTKYRLTEHLNTHNDAISFNCDECSKSFKSMYILKIHKLTHSGEKSYGCEICGKQFRRRGELTRHSSIHTGKLPHECTYCKKQFREKYYLKVHLRQHTGERPYSCTLCNHHFASDGNFIKHIKKKHGVQNVSIANKRQYPFDQ